MVWDVIFGRDAGFSGGMLEFQGILHHICLEQQTGETHWDMQRILLKDFKAALWRDKTLFFSSCDVNWQDEVYSISYEWKLYCQTPTIYYDSEAIQET